MPLDEYQCDRSTQFPSEALLLHALSSGILVSFPPLQMYRYVPQSDGFLQFSFENQVRVCVGSSSLSGELISHKLCEGETGAHECV